MSRFIPSGWLAGGLLVVWLLLNESLHPAHLLLGGLLAVLLPWLLRPLMPLALHLRRPLALLRFISGAGVEIVRSCFNVSRVILFGRDGDLNSEFIRVPLDLRDPLGLTVLSCAINSTPGTVWVELLPETHELVLHVFDLHDAQWWVDTIKSQYEQPLIDIFEAAP